VQDEVGNFCEILDNKNRYQTTVDFVESRVTQQQALRFGKAYEQKNQHNARLPQKTWLTS